MSQITIYRRLFTAGAFTALACWTGLAAGVPLALPSVPLFVATAAEPNIMLVIDSSGSMSNVVPETPYDPRVRYTATTALPTAPVTNCPTNPNRTVPTTNVISVAIRAGQAPRFFYGTNGNNATVRTFGAASGQLCFDQAATYSAKLAPGPATTSTLSDNNVYQVPDGYNEADYSGNYLNWYFNSQSIAGLTWTGATTLKPLTATSTVSSRIQIARNAATNLVDAMDSRLRVGLAVYDNDTGGKLADTNTTGIGPLATNGIDNGKRTQLKAAISNIVAAGSTPLAETLASVARYFTSGNSPGTTLALHPLRTNRNSCGNGSQSCDQDPATVFTRRLGGAVVDPAIPPVSLSCQKNFITFLTDGRNTFDQDISPDLRDYDGDCTANSPNYVGASVCSGIGANNYERKTTRLYDEAINTNGRGTSDYMDDVAQALYEMDLRPSGFAGASAEENAFVNNIRTDMIGFADPTVANDPLLINTAAQGGGTFRSAADSAALASAFTDIINNILTSVGSSSNASTSSSRLDTGSRLYQATFNSGDWSGSFKAQRISDGNTTGCTGVPRGNICPTSDWDSAVLLDAKAAASRVIYTYKPSTQAGVLFNWANLDAAQQTLLNLNPGTLLADGRGQQRLNYLRGDRSQEGGTSAQFRTRSSKLGDIVNTDPVLVSSPRFNYNFTGYGDFRSSQINRTPMIYLGANDGMLHGFNANTGEELMAYVPRTAYGTLTSPTLSKLTQNPYTHQFVVDGSPQYGDVQLGPSLNWASVLVGTMRSGGKGVFALNVTNPNNFTANSNADAASVVMWEFTDADDPSLGNTFSVPSIVKLRNGKWAAIFGNGYNSAAADGKAALYIVYMDGPGADGVWNLNTDYFKLTVNSAFSVASAGVIASGVPNGLASPTPIDLDGDRLVDFVYAGDLNGNLWRFDLDSATPSNWTVAYANAPVYTARDGSASNNRQPITGRVEVSSNLNTPNDNTDVTVYFGTGKYLEGADNTQTNQPNQSFYAIHDAIFTATGTTKTTAPQASGRAALLKQSILQEVTSSNQTFRVTTNTSYNTTTPEKGWYIDLFNTNNVAAAAGGPGANRGERSVSAAVLSAGRVLFSTQIPPANVCSGGGTGFLMSLDAKNGKRLPDSPFDSNGDGVINDSDVVSSTTGSVTVSGVQSRVGIIDKPVIFNISNTEDILYLTGTGKPGTNPTPACGSTLECAKTPSIDRRGRITWREIIK